MSRQDLRIVFMGTPAFAVASLQALAEAGFTIAGVVTAPDKPAGRGMQLQHSAVKQYALQHGLPLLQPEKLKSPEFLAALAAWQAHIQVVVAFRMLPEVVWNMPPMGTINVHGSLLPQYRGAAPIHWAVINGEPQTGITTFKLKHAIDTGDMLLQQSLPIGPHETTGQLHDRMMALGAQLIVQTMDGLLDGSLTPTPQPEQVNGQALKHAPKIFTDTCRINWQQPATQVYNLIRGLSPYPGAFTTLAGKMLKIYHSQCIAADHPYPPGTMRLTENGLWQIAATPGWIQPLEVQFEGKKKMQAADFLRGYKGELKL